MHEPMQNPYPANVQVELARERNRIAADRTLLSFVRSSASLIAIGTGVSQVLQRLTPSARYLNIWIYGLSLSFVGLGVINLIFAAIDYQGELARLRQPDYCFTPRWSLGGVTGSAVLMAGLVIFLWLYLPA
ncbi:MAG: DUF202 domain-containing protein [Nodosilinea sp.]